MPANSAILDHRPSVDTRVGILPTKAPGLSRGLSRQVVEMFGSRDKLPEVERPATSAATDFRVNHRTRKITKEDNELRKLFSEVSSHASIPPRARPDHCARPGHTALRFATSPLTSRRALQFDTNGDGCLDALEMTNVLKNMNKFESEAQVTAIIKGLDANGDGKVQLRELVGFRVS